MARHAALGGHGWDAQKRVDRRGTDGRRQPALAAEVHCRGEHDEQQDAGDDLCRGTSGVGGRHDGHGKYCERRKADHELLETRVLHRSSDRTVRPPIEVRRRRRHSVRLVG